MSALCCASQVYAKFSGAPLTVNTINNSWRAPKGDVPVLISKDIVVSQPAKILNLRKQIYRDAKECLNLLSKRLGTSQVFFGNTPTTLDAFVFGFLAPIYKVWFPRVQLQEHLKQLPNPCRFCDDILTCYFSLTISGPSLAGEDTADANLQKLIQLVNKESNLIEKES